MPLFKVFSSVRLVEEISRTGHDRNQGHIEDHDDGATLPTFQANRQAPARIAPSATFGKSGKSRSARRQSQISSVRQHRKSILPFMRRSGYYTYAKKGKSQKLLSLWPLPVLTRYTILLSAIISALNALQLIHLSCSSPKFVLFRHEIVNLLLSPFLFSFSMHGVALFAWNVLILGLFEESLTRPLGGTRCFLHIVLAILFAVCSIRQGIGYLFSRSTGWAVPTLFFSDSIHECNQGLAPFLFSLLVIQSISIDDKYVLIYDSRDDEGNRLTISKVMLQLCMLLVNYTVKNILWWSLTGLLTGYVAAIVIQATMSTGLGHDGVNRAFDDESGNSLYSIRLPLDDDGEAVNEKSTRSSTPGAAMAAAAYLGRIPLWRILWSSVQRGTLVLMITLPLLFLCNAYYQQEHFVDELTLNNTISDADYLFSMVVMTAPRRGDPAYLTKTLQSYLDQWPLLPDTHASAVAPDNTNAGPLSLYDRLKIIVYTHFSEHVEYDRARAHFRDDAKAQRYLTWVQHDDNDWNHRRHMAGALKHAVSQEKTSAYIALLEDDFPICGRHAWREIENIIYLANTRVPNHCGVFVGTGGSGLFLKPDIARLASDLLFKYDDMPPDIVIQQCLLGKLPECASCQQQLVISKTLLMHHIGYNTSTSDDRSYKKNEFQCNWRHPFVSPIHQNKKKKRKAA
ncbi:hypothetical protein BC940DRAFT_270282 [Gongronella butleri]|nr:hypothetical protein BC940DRAFT_270282 [Gongronella butleri]